jgi:hypothetical protein
MPAMAPRHQQRRVPARRQRASLPAIARRARGGRPPTTSGEPERQVLGVRPGGGQRDGQQPGDGAVFERGGGLARIGGFAFTIQRQRLQAACPVRVALAGASCRPAGAGRSGLRFVGGDHPAGENRQPRSSRRGIGRGQRPVEPEFFAGAAGELLDQQRAVCSIGRGRPLSRRCAAASRWAGAAQAGEVFLAAVALTVAGVLRWTASGSGVAIGFG